MTTKTPLRPRPKKPTEELSFTECHNIIQEARIKAYNSFENDPRPSHYVWSDRRRAVESSELKARKTLPYQYAETIYVEGLACTEQDDDIHEVEKRIDIQKAMDIIKTILSPIEYQYIIDLQTASMPFLQDKYTKAFHMAHVKYKTTIMRQIKDTIIHKLRRAPQLNKLVYSRESMWDYTHINNITL